MNLFDLATAQRREAQRQMDLLGNLANADYDYDRLRQRSDLVHVPSKSLWQWWHNQHKQGIEGLIPTHWKPLDEASQTAVIQRYASLTPLVDAIAVTDEEIAALALRNNWSPRTGQRWFERYRIGGLWGLAPAYDPEKATSKKLQAPSRAPATLDEAACKEIERRLLLLGDLIKQAYVSCKDAEDQGKMVGVTGRTILAYAQLYQTYGLFGLAPKQRSDKGEHHRITGDMKEIIRGLRYYQPKVSIRAIHEEACWRARALGEPEPTVWQVRQICAEISPSDLLLAEGREGDFRDQYAITVSMRYIKEANRLIIFEIDHTLVDVLVKDTRSEHLRAPSQQIRPWLTLCLEQRSRLIMAAMFSFDRPDRHTVAATLREAILVSEEKPFGGIPDEVWVDRGKELLAEHIQRFTQELKTTLHPCKPHYPEEKGETERFFGTLNTRVWAKQRGYVDSNTVERNPNAQAELTLAELEAKFKEFVQQYHREVHSQTGYTPLDYWMKFCWAERADPRVLDRLLKEAKVHKVHKFGIKHDNRLYWHTALADHVGKQVTIRAAPTYSAPDEIEVYYRDQWICTAIAMDSKAGRALTASDVGSAKKEQRGKARQRKELAQDAVERADSEIEAIREDMRVEGNAVPIAPQEVPDLDLATKESKERPKDFLDLLEDDSVA